MRKATIPMLSLALVYLAAAACDRPEAPRRGAEPSALADAGIPALYERRLVFLGDDGGRPVQAVLGFSVADSGELSARRASGWLFRSAWERVLDEAWSTPQMREPWRLLPHGRLRLIAGDDERIEAVVVEREERVRIVPGTELATYATAPTLDYAVRKGRLRVGAREHEGVLLDLQRVRALRDTVVREGEGQTIMLLGGEDTRLVVVDGKASWIEQGARLRTVEGVRLVAGARGLHIEAPGGALGGELEVIDTAPVEDGRLLSVRGWIERAGRRRAVAGAVLDGVRP